MRLEHKIYCFFDENRINEFLMLYKSISKIYSDFEVFAFVPFEDELGFASIADDKRFKKYVLNHKNIDKDFFAKFNKNGTPDHIDSIMAFGRLLISNEFENINRTKNEKIIYLDIDMLLIKPISSEFLSGEDNYVFLPETNENNDFWETYYLFREGILLRKDKNKLTSFSEEILTKIKKREYFNSGIMIINSIKKFENITKKITLENAEIYSEYSDQDLLNYFNTSSSFKIVNDQTQNWLTYIPRNFNEDVSVLHFAGNNKQKTMMKLISDEELTIQNYFENNSKRKIKEIFNTDILGNWKIN